MPDNQDYEWFGGFLNHPEEWTAEDLDTARFVIATQKQAVEESHPKDLKGRQRLQEVVDRLEAAVEAYHARGG